MNREDEKTEQKIILPKLKRHHDIVVSDGGFLSITVVLDPGLQETCVHLSV